MNEASAGQIDDAVGVAFDAEGRYRVREVLGSGSHGVVYRVLDSRWGQEIALKTIRDPSPELRQWLKAEYRHLRDIVHPNLVRLHDLHVGRDQCFFTMDIVPESAAFNHRLDFDRSGVETAQRAGVRRVCGAAAQLFDALGTVHALGKCHRDIKPNNILVGRSDRVVLLDFGLAGLVERSRELDTARGALLGTLPYLAPEQYLDARPRPASDLYSAGLVLYEALVGSLPFTGDAVQVSVAKRRRPPPPSSLVAAIPPELDALVLALLDPDPEARPDGNRVLAELLGLADGLGVSARVMRSPSSDGDALFVGRERELHALRQAYRVAESGRFSTIDVVGPSGIGKTALVRRFLRELAEDTASAPLVLEARCHPQESIPYKAFDAAIDDLTRHWVGLDERAASTICPREGAGALAVIFPELRRVPVLDVHASGLLRHGDPRALRRSGFEALSSVLAKLRTRTPVVLWVDDVQWADVDSAALVEGVFGGERPPPVLLVVSRRPDDDGGASSLSTAIARTVDGGARSVVELGPLGSTASRELAVAIAGGSGAVGAAMIQTILEEAAGVPYLVSELAHFVAEQRDVPDEARVGATAGSLTRERLLALSESDRVLLELAALCGGPQSADVLLAAAGRGDRSRIRDLCVLRLLRWSGAPVEARVQIYHDRLREFIVHDLAKPARALHHLALVAAMEASASADPEQMLTHALEAGDRGRACTHALAAARRAGAALAFEQAAKLYRIALDNAQDEGRSELLERLAEALEYAGRSSEAAPMFEAAFAASAEAGDDAETRRALLRRRAGEQYLKAGQYEGGLRLMASCLAAHGVVLPKSGTSALLVSTGRRAKLYLRGFDFQVRDPGTIPAATRTRLDDLWALTTSMSMMDPVRADGIGLLHFLEALRNGDAAHIARSLGYEAAFASLIGGNYMRKKAKGLLDRNREALALAPGSYELAFLELCEGSVAFFHSDWDTAVERCDAAARRFRTECRGAEYEAATSLVFGLQALGLAGRVSELVVRIPESIREADARGDLFASNNYRAGFHALGRIAAGQVAEVRADLALIKETWDQGFYQMHAYHRVFAGVSVDLYEGLGEAALARIEGDWSCLRDGLFLRMELPATELRWTLARATLAAALSSEGSLRRNRLAKVRSLIRAIAGATVPAAGAHAAMLRAGLAGAEESGGVAEQLAVALSGYENAGMAVHREVARWLLSRCLEGAVADDLREQVEGWMTREGVPSMRPLAATIGPGIPV